MKTVFGKLFLTVAPFWRNYRLLVDPNISEAHLLLCFVKSLYLPVNTSIADYLSLNQMKVTSETIL